MTHNKPDKSASADAPIPCVARVLRHWRRAAGPILTLIDKPDHDMKTKTVVCLTLLVAAFSLTFGYAYHLGYSRGNAEERLHCLAAHSGGAWTTHFLIKRGRGVAPQDASVNSIPAVTIIKS